jgi:hypothetical protein
VEVEVAVIVGCDWTSESFILLIVVAPLCCNPIVEAAPVLYDVLLLCDMMDDDLSGGNVYPHMGLDVFSELLTALPAVDRDVFLGFSRSEKLIVGASLRCKICEQLVVVQDAGEEIGVTYGTVTCCAGETN